MRLLFWFSVCCLLTADSAEPLKYLLSVAGVVLVGLTVNHFVERRGGVKFLLLCDGWVEVGERWLTVVKTRRSVFETRRKPVIIGKEFRRC